MTILHDIIMLRDILNMEVGHSHRRLDRLRTLSKTAEDSDSNICKTIRLI